MNLYNLSLNEMEEYFLANGDKKFHASQLFTWMYQKKIHSLDEVTDIKKEMLDKIKQDFSFDRLEIVKIEKDVDVSKYLFKLSDSEHIEYLCF